MGVDCGEVRLLRRLINAPSPVSVGTISCGRPARDETQRGPSDLVMVPFPQPGLKKSRPRAVFHTRAERHHWPFSHIGRRSFSSYATG